MAAAGDQYEQEADRVAKQVVRASRQPDVQREEGSEGAIQASRYASSMADYQRSATPVAAGSSRVQRGFFARPQMPQVQRDDMEEDELQASPNHGMEGGDVDTDVARTIQSAKGGGQPLHDGVRSSMEKGFGADFSGVNVHTDSESDALNRSLNAKAFTTGPDIFFGKGQYNPGSTSGQELIAHELTHTVQQGAAQAHTAQAQREEDASSALPSHPATVDNSTIQRALRTLAADTHSRDASFQKKVTAYKRGDKVDVNTMMVQQDFFGNEIYYKIIGTDEYISATKLSLSDRVNQEVTSKQRSTLDPGAVAVIHGLRKEKKFKVPVHGKPEKVKMREAEGRDAQYQKGFLTPGEEQAIKTLSQTEEGKIFLSQKGFLNDEEVERYARSVATAGMWERYQKHDFVDPTWELDTPSSKLNEKLSNKGILPKVQGDSILSNVHRLQIATRQKDLGIADEKFRNTPGYLRYEGFQVKNADSKEEREQFRQNIYGSHERRS